MLIFSPTCCPTNWDSNWLLKIFIYLVIHSLLAVLSLHYYAQALSSYSEQGLPSSCGVQASHCGGFPCCGAQAVGRVGSVVVAPRLWSSGPVVVVHGLSCSASCGLFWEQGSNPCLLHWRVDSLPLSHQGSPATGF